MTDSKKSWNDSVDEFCMNHPVTTGVACAAVGTALYEGGKVAVRKVVGRSAAATAAQTVAQESAAAFGGSLLKIFG